MKYMKATRVASAALAPLAMAAITIGAAAPAFAASPAVAGTAAPEHFYDANAIAQSAPCPYRGNPAGGTGNDPGPNTSPGYRGNPAGGTGDDPGPNTSPGYCGNPAGAIG
jgi:hypothetical protein